MNKLKKDLRRCLTKFKRTQLNPLLEHPCVQWIKSHINQRVIVLSLLFVVVSLICANVLYQPIPPKQSTLRHLDDVTVLIETKRGSGTGTLFSRRDDKGNLVHFVWTAGHVIESSKVGPLEDMSVSFTNVSVAKMNLVGGAMLEKVSYPVKVIKFSSARGGDDLALLELVEKNVFKENESVTFASPSLVAPGTLLYHVGCMFGQTGYNSVSEGMLANNGRIIYGRIFDQTTTTVFPGSSGGGIFNEYGEYVGMVTMMRQANMNYIIPVRRMVVWAKENGLEWAMNKDVRMPGEYLRDHYMKDAELDTEFEMFRYFMLQRWQKGVEIQRDLQKQIEKLNLNLQSLRKELGKTNIISEVKPTNAPPAWLFRILGGEDEEEDDN